MNWLANLSIRAKLISILMLTSAAGLLVIGIALVANDVRSFYQDQRRNLAALTSVLGKNSAASLTFGDFEAAADVLAALKSEPQVVQACLFTVNGQLFARYDRDPNPKPCVADTAEHSVFTRRGVSYSHGIVWKGEAVGSIYLRSDFSGLQARLKSYFLIVLLVMLGSVLIAFLLGLRLQRVISLPIIGLAKTAARVSAEQNYSIRAQEAGKDELGLLTARFNEMLAEIEKRDDELQRHRQRLEMEVEARTQAESEIRKSRDLLDTFVLHAPASLVMLDREMCCVHASIRWCKEHAVERQQLLGRSYFEIVPDLTEYWKEALQRALAGEVMKHDDDCLMGLDGKMHWLRWEIRPWSDCGSETNGIIIISEDVTERKEAERERTKLLTILEQSPESIALAEPDGTLAYLNPAGRKLVGLDSAEQVRATHMGDFQWPEDHTAFETSLDFSRQGRKCHGEQRLCHFKTHQAIPVMTTNFGLFDGEGNLTGLVAVYRDIRERKELEGRLSVATEQLRAVLESTQDYVIAVDNQLRVTYANRIPGCVDTSAAVGRALCECCPQLADARFSEPFRRAVGNRNPTQFEEYCACDRIWFSVAIYPSPGGLLLFLRDVTEKRSFEEQFRHAQKLEAIGQLASGIAHEINTPVQYVGDNTTFLGESWSALVPVFSAARKLREEAGNGPVSRDTMAAFDESVETADLDCLIMEVPSAIEQSLDGIRRTAKIVRAMKEFSHPGGEERCAIDINRAIETTITVARNVWKYVADVETELDPSLPLVPCYLGEFNQVILNLIVNAAHAIADVVSKAANGKGKITVTTKHVVNTVEIAIRDTGTGIPEEIQSRIFEPFFTTKEVGKGTGQGLALAHSIIVKKHGGKIWFESESKKGTTFFLRLPLKS